MSAEIHTKWRIAKFEAEHAEAKYKRAINEAADIGAKRKDFDCPESLLWKAIALKVKPELDAAKLERDRLWAIMSST